MTKKQALERATVLFAEADALWQRSGEQERQARVHTEEANRLNSEAYEKYAVATDLRFN